MTITIGSIVAEVRDVNTALGWRDEDKTLGDFVALLLSEVAETLEAYRDHRLTDATDHERYNAAGLSKPEGVGSELADMLIRLVDMCDVRSIALFGDGVTLDDVDPFPGQLRPNAPHRLRSFGDHMAWLSAMIVEMWAVPDPGALRVLRALVTVADEYGINLTAEYTRKIAYNRTRPYQHGGRTVTDAAVRAGAVR